jgi:tRNA pseudouridine55 synthase
VLFRSLKLGNVKTGHAGTLDPLATGLLIICTGKFTKRIEEFQEFEKEYTGTFVLGSTTPSYDLETEVIQTGDFSQLTEEKILEAAKQFTGSFPQIPPIYSARYIDGKRAYSYARAGKEVVMEARVVDVPVFEINRISLPEIDFRICCTKGTYIRSIARDMGEYLGCGAYLSALCRTRIGEYKLESACSIEEFEQQALLSLGSDTNQ